MKNTVQSVKRSVILRMGIVPENNYGYQVIERETIVNSAEANDNINSLINSLHPDVRMYLDFSVKEMGIRKDITCSLSKS